MNASFRIMAVDDDPRLHQLFEYYLRPPEFQLRGFTDPYDALMQIRDIAPDLVLCDLVMPGLDGRTFYRAVKKSPQLKDVPFIFLSTDRNSEEHLDELMAAGDELMRKPFPVRRLVERIRELVSREGPRVEEPAAPLPLSGPVAPVGILSLLRLCEDSSLTGRFRVEVAGEIRWADFISGELVQAGFVPEVASVDALDRLLATQAGRYWIEQRPVDADALRRPEGAEAAATAPCDVPPPVPVGRFSIVDAAGASVQVQTDAEQRPNFVITTIVAQAGRGVRKFETAWPHPLKRAADEELARKQIDEQHERTLAVVQELGLEAPRRRTVWSFEGGDVEGSLLAWAMSMVGEQARTRLGRVATVALLRRTLKRLLKERDTLRYFRVADDGRVVLEEPGSATRTTFSGKARLPPGAVDAIGVWLAAFLADAESLDERAAGISVRHVTRMMASDLEAIGFYAAFDAGGAAGRSGELRSSGA